MPLGEALRLAESKELDLVEVSPTAAPPVCRIMDYGKFRYLQKKKVQESRKHQTQVLVKEVKLGSRTSEHDIDFKVNHIRRFLEKKQRVKVSVFFRGREITHPEIGKRNVRTRSSRKYKISVQPKDRPGWKGAICQS